MLDEALAIRLAVHGEGHRAVAITANNLAAAYFFRGQLDDAIRVQEVAVKALRQAVGPRHQRTVVALGNLAAFRRTAGDWEGADGDYRELLAIQSGLQGADHPIAARVKASLAQVVLERGVAQADDSALAEAESFYREALASFESRLGAEHPQVAVTAAWTAMAISERGRHDEALPLAENAVRILRATLGDANPNTLGAVGRLALIHWRLGSRDQAVGEQRRLVADLERGGGGNPEAAMARSVLCDFLLTRGGPDVSEAAEQCDRATAALEGAPAGYRRNLPYVRLRLAQARLALGERAAAESIAAQVRAGLDGNRGNAPARRVLDSLSAALRGR
ncbi:MAG: tetratricopeptide repeat protein [Gemmatimonadales bacterium]